MKSRKQLSETLVKMGRLPEGHDYRKFSNEVYGRKACIYLWTVTKSREDRRELENALIAEGFKVNKSYWPGSSAIEVQVSYFKGLHWDE